MKIFLYIIITLGEFSQIISFLYSYRENNRNNSGPVIVNTGNQWSKESYVWQPGQA